jgi:MFS family permease
MPAFPLIASAIVSSLAVGFLPSLLDGLKKQLSQRLVLSENRVEKLSLAFYLAWLPGMPLAGWVMDFWPSSHKEVLFFGLVATTLFLAWLGVVQSQRGLFAVMTALGLAYSCVAVGCVQLMPLALSYRGSSTAALNFGFVFVALGALFGPLACNAIERWWGQRQGLLFLSFNFLVPAALIAMSDALPRVPETEIGLTLSQPHLWLIAFIVLIYFAIENCLEFWPESFLKQIGFGESGIKGSLLIFWLAFIGARVFVGFFLHTSGQVSEIWLLAVLLFISAICIGNLVGANEWSSGILGFWMIGLCYGPLLPGFLGLALKLFPGLPGTALGVLLALSGLDTLLVRPLMAHLTAKHPARKVMFVPTLLAVVLLAPLVLLGMLRN